MRTRLITTIVALIAVAAISGCGPSVNNTQGFSLSSVSCLGDASVLPQKQCLPGSTFSIIPNVPVGGAWQGSLQGAQGTVKDFGVDVPNYTNVITTGNSGTVFIANAEAPAYWNFDFLIPFTCGEGNYIGLQTLPDGTTYSDYQTTNVLMQNLGSDQYQCISYDTLSASTRFAIQGNFPSSITLGSATPFTTRYGMPKLYVYGGTGNLVATETATSVAGNGATATFPFPSTLTESAYSLAVLNATAASPGYSPAGTNVLSIAQSQTILGNPFGVSVASQTDSWEDRDSCDRTTTSGTSAYTVPVISLYSKGEVLIGNNAVSVGSNPTAVIAYNAVDVRSDTSDSCDDVRDDVSGQTQALVANSGSNSISVLDVVNNAVLQTISVGSQPVALAVSSDGTTAYEANYAGGTVSKISLSSYSVISTVAVGGSPTSLVLSAAGELWVGGVGFLTEVNPQTMSVTATQTTNKTIVALGYSDSFGQLVATSTDTSGNVYAESLKVATFSNGTYTPSSTANVSTSGSHFNVRTNAQAASFTQTMAGSSILNVNQVGAPPLVVRDGWAVVTATPTGFTVSDISGNGVLISESTPSPVTAIAVDTNLSVAYLMLPDANTVLMVPLPGVAAN